MLVAATSKASVNSNIIVNTGEDGSYAIPRLPVGDYMITATNPGGGSRAAKDVTVEAGKQLRLDIDIEVGEIKLTIVIEGEGGAKIDAARVVLVKGALAPKNVKEFGEAFLDPSKSSGAKVGLAIGAAPAVFDDVSPDDYSVCVIPINGDLNDPTFQVRLGEHAESLKVYCKRHTVTSTPKEQTYTAVTPPMEPLPEPTPAPEK